MRQTGYRYRPVLFFVLTYLFTWIFWVPAIFVSENAGSLLMVVGLIAPAVVSTVFVLASGSEALKRDLKQKIFGFYKVKWRNVLLAVLVFAGTVACSILLSLAFGQSLDQFSFTEDFSFTGVGVGSALLTILVASVIEEVGWKGYCEDSIGNYMNWFWESMIFGALWSFWHFPLIFIKGTYQAGLMVNPLYVINFFISGIPLGFIITWVYLASDGRGGRPGGPRQASGACPSAALQPRLSEGGECHPCLSQRNRRPETAGRDSSVIPCSVPGSPAPVPGSLREPPGPSGNHTAGAACQGPQPVLFCRTSG